MKSRLSAAIFTALALIVCLSVPAMACTIFTAVQEDGTVLAGNNEDYSYSINNSMVVTAPGEKGYGRICFYNLSYIQGGMNEHGLFYDGASCPPAEVPYHSDKETLGYDLGDIVLARCASVEEAERFFENYNIPGGFYDHLLFADSTGDSAVFEWVEGELRIIRKGQDEKYQAVTNFWLTAPSLGGYPCDRYNTVVDFLQNHSPSIEACAAVLNSTKQDWGSGGTLYSNVFDLSNKVIYVFNRGKMDQACKIDMEGIFQSMQAGLQTRYDLNDLTYDILITVGDISNVAPTETDVNIVPEFDGDSNGDIKDGTVSYNDTETTNDVSAMSTLYDDWIFWVIVISIPVLILIVAVRMKKSTQAK